MDYHIMTICGVVLYLVIFVGIIYFVNTKQRDNSNIENESTNSLDSDFLSTSYDDIANDSSQSQMGISANVSHNPVSASPQSPLEKGANGVGLKSVHISHDPISAHVSHDPISAHVSHNSISANVSHDPVSAHISHDPVSANGVGLNSAHVSHDPVSAHISHNSISANGVGLKSAHVSHDSISVPQSHIGVSASSQLQMSKSSDRKVNRVELNDEFVKKGASNSSYNKENKSGGMMMTNNIQPIVMEVPSSTQYNDTQSVDVLHLIVECFDFYSEMKLLEWTRPIYINKELVKQWLSNVKEVVKTSFYQLFSRVCSTTPTGNIVKDMRFIKVKYGDRLPPMTHPYKNMKRFIPHKYMELQTAEQLLNLFKGKFDRLANAVNLSQEYRDQFPIAFEIDRNINEHSVWYPETSFDLVDLRDTGW